MTQKAICHRCKDEYIICNLNSLGIKVCFSHFKDMPYLNTKKEFNK